MRHDEDNEAMVLMRWAALMQVAGIGRISDYLIAIPNGGKRNPREAARLKRMGVKGGVSDYFLAFPRNGFHGLWIELKAEGGRVSEAQGEWIKRMRLAGYQATIAWGWTEAREAILYYLEP
ncbi:MAG: VRR-NUC domain-containing protein [Terriglobia bacterium]